jgi:calcineurin-like phosphoesterase family protein
VKFSRYKPFFTRWFRPSNHNKENRENGILRYDVGADANNYAPVSIKEIEKFMEVQ